MVNMDCNMFMLNTSAILHGNVICPSYRVYCPLNIILLPWNVVGRILAAVTEMSRNLWYIKLYFIVKEERTEFGGEEDSHDGDFLWNGEFSLCRWPQNSLK